MLKLLGCILTIYTCRLYSPVFIAVQLKCMPNRYLFTNVERVMSFKIGWTYSEENSKNHVLSLLLIKSLDSSKLHLMILKYVAHARGYWDISVTSFLGQHPKYFVTVVLYQYNLWRLFWSVVHHLSLLEKCGENCDIWPLKTWKLVDSLWFKLVKFILPRNICGCQ